MNSNPTPRETSPHEIAALVAAPDATAASGRTPDERWMQLAIDTALAPTGRGWTSPRPCVGCVIVRDGQLLGAGHTQPGYGKPHAEIAAIRAAWTADPVLGPRGAVAYTTLEPCSHWGTTPPCCDALVREGLVRVVVGIEDPDPRVSGRGLARMRAVGIEVTENVLRRECFRSMDDFLMHIAQQRPFVTLKAAVTLDGKIALPSGESKWITGDSSRQFAQVLRHQHDAIVVGIETVLQDNPSLSARPVEQFKQPRRIVLDSLARLPLDAALWNDAPQVHVFVAEAAPAVRVAALRERGALVHLVPRGEGGGLDWLHILVQLYSEGICSLLIEGGARVAGSALEAGIVNKTAFFIAPKLMGAGRSALERPLYAHLSEVEALRDVTVHNLDGDALVQGYFAHPAFEWL